MKKFTEQIEFEPAYDFVVKPTKKHGSEYGRHGVTIRFVLIGEKGAVQFVMYTNWMPLIKKRGDFRYRPTFISSNPEMNLPMAADIGYHSPVPQYDNQTKRDDCQYLDGAPCYYDGSTLSADRYMVILFNKGKKSLFRAMRQYYKERFNER